MPEIKQLDRHVADLIAAGEVVERPASVVKELMENAIDAGAAKITVEIENGGMTLIRVTDDGCGIPPEQVTTAFLRHATSKLRQEADLEAIGTLGFRGEALAAIAAVARVEILTRTPDAPFGTALTLDGGVPGEKEQTGCPPGTTLLVRNLFYNTPARLKFMKKDVAEGTAVAAVVQRLALSHPEVSVKFIREGKQELLTPGDGQLRSAIYAVLGRDLALGFLPISGGDDQTQVEGFVSLPVCCRGTRGYQHFFVNGRYVKSRTMMAALEEAYKNQKMVGKFPGCVLHLTLSPASVDVNVHPTKTEVKFVSDKQVFDTVYYTVLSALTGETPRPAMEFQREDPQPSPPPSILPVRPPVPKAHTLRSRPTDFPHSPFSPSAAPSLPEKGQDSGKEPSSETRMPQPPKKTPAPGKVVPPPVSLPKDTPPLPSQPKDIPPLANLPEEVSLPSQEQEDPPSLPCEETPWQVAGELFRTYILVEQGDRVLLIDKHAAHERMHFDRMKREDYRPMSQRLLLPKTVSLSPEEKGALLEHLPLLEEYGFEVEDFGGNSLLVRQVPFDLPDSETETTLALLANRLLTTGHADPTSARDELLHTMACKAAIKGGWKNAGEELAAVAAAVMDGSVKYCPHGRPVAIEMTKKQLEKQFKRT